jgi:citrate lyase beta subunit
MMAKAGSRGADVLVLDLEDGVHPDLKGTAREQLRGAVERFDWVSPRCSFVSTG